MALARSLSIALKIRQCTIIRRQALCRLRSRTRESARQTESRIWLARRQPTRSVHKRVQRRRGWRAEQTFNRHGCLQQRFIFAGWSTQLQSNGQSGAQMMNRQGDAALTEQVGRPGVLCGESIPVGHSFYGAVRRDRFGKHRYRRHDPSVSTN